MEERILELKNLYDSGIEKNLFFELINNSTSGAGLHHSSYSNNLSKEEWKKLFAEPFINIDVSENQVELFFEYMVKHSKSFFGKNQGRYFVIKSLTDDEKKECKFQFEVILLTAFKII